MLRFKFVFSVVRGQIPTIFDFYQTVLWKNCSARSGGMWAAKRTTSHSIESNPSGEHFSIKLWRLQFLDNASIKRICDEIDVNDFAPQSEGETLHFSGASPKLGWLFFNVWIAYSATLRPDYGCAHQSPDFRLVNRDSFLISASKDMARTLFAAAPVGEDEDEYGYEISLLSHNLYYG